MASRDVRMKKLPQIFAFLISLLACRAYTSSNMWTVAVAQATLPHWSVVECPREWPHELNGSNAIVQSVDFMEQEIAKAETFLDTRNYTVVEGGIKGDSPHVTVMYPDPSSDQWTIFFTKTDLKPYSIERKGKTRQSYLIHLDPRNKLLMKMSSEDSGIDCNPPGVMRGFGQTIRDKLAYTVLWDAKGHLYTEDVFDWSRRGQPIHK